MLRLFPVRARAAAPPRFFCTTRALLNAPSLKQFTSNVPPISTSSLQKAISCSSDPKPFVATPKQPHTARQPNVHSSHSLKKILRTYLQLSKPRLTALVVLSSICSYALTPLNATVPQLIFLTAGTALCSAAANAINMGREPVFDKMMTRTAARPIVRGALTAGQAYRFAALSSVLGVSTLYLGVNLPVAVLGGLNIVLYAWIYTSLKRVSILNTWVGAIVGAIPPLMGWAASSPLSDPGAWCLAGLLYAWQFPHFNALSHNLRNEYKAAGYVMTSFVNPMLNARVGLRYSLLMFPLCVGLCYYGVTDWLFALDSAVLNSWLSYWAFQFWWQQRKNYRSLNGGTPSKEGLKLATLYATKMFWGSVWHLPGILVLAMLHKKGRWDWLFGESEPATASSSTTTNTKLKPV